MAIISCVFILARTRGQAKHTKKTSKLSGQLTLAAFTRGIILFTFGPSLVAQSLTSAANGSLPY